MNFFEVAIFCKGILHKSLACYKTFEEADTYRKIHKYEISEANSEEMRIIPRAFDSTEHTPEISRVNVQTFSMNNDTPFSLDRRYWELEKITPTELPECFSKIVINPEDAFVFQDEIDMPSSFTIVFPVKTSDLINEVYTTTKLINIAKAIFEKVCKEKPQTGTYGIADFLSNEVEPEKLKSKK